jgi:uncharacterized protein (TIGR04551 family)
MIRLVAAALAAALLAPGAARAQAQEQAPAKAETPAKPEPTAKPDATAKPGLTAKPSADQLDPKTRAILQQEIEKAKEEIRNEVRAEMQGAQAAAEFLGAVSESPKLEFLQLDGYMRFRGDLFDDFSLSRGPDVSGYYLFPPIQNPISTGSLATANMRFRLEPTLNVSEYVRVRAQIDIFDNYVLGSTPGANFSRAGSPYAVPFWSSDRGTSSNDPTVDRAPIIPKRAWGEVQTPVGLLSFGRMPSQWGLGILANSGQGIDQDFGDTVDRLQFAIAPVTTPLGKLSFVPILDFDAEGPLHFDTRVGPGAGQPFDLTNSDDARTVSLKVARIDTDDEIRRKLERNESSLNYGAYYSYRTQSNWSPLWYTPNATLGDPTDTSLWVKQRAYVNYLSLWGRFQTPHLRFETELAGVYGHAGNASNSAGGTTPALALHQWGGVLRVEWDAMPSKLVIAGEAGIASGDTAPGFGNQPDRLAADASGNPILPDYGSVDGPQWSATDHTISNFRFNPAYRIDLIFWREIMGQITDAWYLRPSMRWTIVPGLNFDLAAIYSQAIYAQSTPSATSVEQNPLAGRGTFATGHKMLGAELDGTLRFDSGSGFQAWLSYGIFQPLDGLGTSLSRANTIRTGLAVSF